ncbi:hypothetical protein ATO3_05030 [Marinibacterium profundimaris]|uniref:Uncharacterized protein n=1 Tax=Marinibacterium profundimaris TaxID=1679460 RepID=A0A225NMH1_9RHOB|nr:hypothetical protein ATO3_05030 [Marinibacterium profundimaris]
MAWIFDAYTGTFLYEARGAEAQAFVHAEEVVILARAPFEATGFGPSVPAKDPTFSMAWVSVGTGAEAAGVGFKVRISVSVEPGLRVIAPPLGSWGARILREGTQEGFVEVRVDPALVEPRVLRMTLSGQRSHAPVTPGPDGVARVSFRSLRLDRPAAPGRAVFDLLVTGASSTGDARAERTNAAYIWPGVGRTPSGNVEDVVAPETFSAAHSAGWLKIAGRLTMDPRHAAPAACLAVSVDGDLAEFEIPFRGVRVWRHRPGVDGRERVAHGAVWLRGASERQDAIVVEGAPSDTDLLIFGVRQRGPFRGSRRLEVPASVLGGEGQDDRIALCHPDGRVETLLRVLQVNDPRRIECFEDDVFVSVAFEPAKRLDGVGIRIEDVSGEVSEGFEMLGPRPVKAPLPSGVSVTLGDRIEVQIRKSEFRMAARATILVREVGESFEELCGSDRHPVAVGLNGASGPSRNALSNLARLAAEPSTAALADQLYRALAQSRTEAARQLAQQGMVRPFLPALAATTSGGRVARGDVLGAAPWLFSRDLSALGAIDQDGMLGALARLETVDADGLPDPSATDATTRWLDRIALAEGLPPVLGGDAMEQAMGLLRLRLDKFGGRPLLSEGVLGGAARSVFAAHSAELARLRAFDLTGGKDALPARITALLERFARASRIGRSDDFLADLVTRTGLPRDTVGEVLTVSVRCGPELFSIILMFWDAACRAHALQSREATP